MTEMKTIKLEGEYTTAQEYAKAKNINSRTLRWQLKQGKIEAVQISGTYLIKIK